jgi:hypothetical protein
MASWFIHTLKVMRFLLDRCTGKLDEGGGRFGAILRASGVDRRDEFLDGVV